MNRILLAVSLVVAAVLIAVGVSLVSIAAALIVGGLLFAGLGWLFFGDMDDTTVAK